MEKERIEKLKKEYEELSQKIDNLENFLETETFENLSFREKSLLRVQRNGMLIYSESLFDRICFYEGK